MSTDRTPIEPSDIRAGDLIREEYAEPWVPERGDLPRTATEYRATDDLKTLSRARASAYYLLDRPTPAVELPTEPTLGILHWGEGEEVSCSEGRWSVENGVVWEHFANGIRGYSRPVEDVTAFERTYALPDDTTAVPTEALDELRRRHRDRFPSQGCIFALDFLAAVDEAKP